MRSRWLATARERVSRIRNRWRPTAVILLYHRVGRLDSDPYGLCVSRGRFEEHLEVVRALARPTRLPDLASALASDSVPDGAVCVTLDDGYRDNLTHARPLLERHGVPATVFVVAGGGGRDREFWWDRLAYLFFEHDPLPERLVVEIGGSILDLSLETRETRPHRDDSAAWRLHDPPPTPRHGAFGVLYERLLPMSAEARERALRELYGRFGAEPVLRESHRTMTPEELVELESGGLVEVGAHTAEHLHLPSHPADGQEEDITVGRDRLEAWLGHPVTTFAYPYGAVSEPSVEAARNAGFQAACAGHWAPVVAGVDRWRLPRVEVGDVSPDVLARHLSNLLGR